jgi:hypothetical protein
MRDAKMIVCLGAFAACIGVPGLSVAEDNCSGHYIHVGTKSVSINDDPAEPAHIMIGECHGLVCIRRDKNGDEQTVESAYTPGDYTATWKVISGTGKYANARGSGWYKQRRADDDVVVGDWGGNCQ